MLHHASTYLVLLYTWVQTGTVKVHVQVHFQEHSTATPSRLKFLAIDMHNFLKNQIRAQLWNYTQDFSSKPDYIATFNIYFWFFAFGARQFVHT